MLDNDNVSKRPDSSGKELIIAALGDNPLRVIQSCETAKSAWEKVHARQARKSTISEFSVSNNLLNVNVIKDANMRDMCLRWKLNFPD